MTAVKLRRIARQLTHCPPGLERPYIALEHIESWTGRLLPIARLPQRTSTGGQGMVAVEPGDVLFGRLGPHLAKGLLVDVPSFASTELVAMRPSGDTDSRFISYLTRSQPFVAWATATAEGTIMPRTNWSKLGDFQLTATSRAGQRAVADFLDAAVERIDDLITKRQRMASLVEERWSAELGIELDPPEAQRRSARTYRLKFACEEIFLGLTSKVDYVEEGGVPLVRAIDIRGGKLTLEDAREISKQQHEQLTRRRRAQRGDLLLSKSGSIGEAAVVDTDREFSIYESIFALRASDQVVLPRYLVHLIRGPRCQAQFAAAHTGMGVPHLNLSDIVDVEVALPSIEAQKAIVGRLDERERRLMGLVERLDRQVQLLREHRQALITAAVTGELEIPEAA